MNKIYKVVWNKARNCYVVASEFAKSHSGSTKRVRVGTTAALMAVAVLTGFAMPAQAAVSIGTDGTVKAEAADINALNNLLKNGVTTTTDGSVTVGGLTVKKNGEVSVNSPDVVYGKDAKINWDGNNTTGQISIGNKAMVVPGRGGQERAFAYDGDATHAAGAIAIGTNTYARTGSIMIGSHVYKGNMGDVKDIDTDVFNTGENGAYGHTVNSTTIGTNSFTKGNLATTIGDYNIQSGKSMGYNDWDHWNPSSLLYGAQNFGATVLGALNSNESQSATISGYGTSGVANSIVGVANRVNSSNGTLVFGAGNEVTNSLSYISGVGDTTSLRDAKNAQDILKKAVNDYDAGGAVLAIGGANKADWAQKSQLIGVGNTLTGASSAVSEYNMINGYRNKVTNATYTSIIGSNNKAKNIQSTTVMGDNNDLTGNGNHVIGDNHKVTGKNNILIGNNKEQKTHSGSDSVIIGNNASAGNGSMAMGNEAHAGNTGIALGMKASAGDGQNLAIGYYANVSGATNSTALGYASKVEKRDILSSDGKDGVVSVGKSVGQSGEAGITRRIINVKAGVNDTDAVNVSQLKGVKAEALKHSTVTNGDANITVTEGLNKDGGKEYKVALNNDITLAGDDPDAFVRISGSKGTIWTSGSVTAGSVAVGTAKADGTTPFFLDSKGAFYAADGKFSVDKDGNANANSIQTNALNSKYNLSVGTMAENGIMPFLVNSTGAFYAANNNFSVDKEGKVIATAGEIGNVVLQNGVYTGNSVLRDGELYLGDASGNYSQITPKSAKLGQVTIDEKGNMAGVNSIQTNALNAKYNLSVGTMAENGIMPFLVNSTGAFYAANNNFSVDKEGKVIATAGEIGNVVLQNGVYTGNSVLRDGELYLGDASGNYSQITPKSAKLGQVTIDEKGNMAGVNSIQTNALNAKYNLSVGTMAENGIMPFLVNSTGAFYAANNNFSVDKDGKVIATAGEIGNVVLQNGVYTGNSVLRDGELYLGDASGNYSQITPKSAKLGQVTIDEKGNMAGVNSIQTNALNAKYNLSVGTMAENGIMPFLVNSTGAFYAANNNFSVDKDGKVIATAGEIGNVVLQNGVYTGNSVLRDGELYVGDASGNYSQITTTGAKLGQVTIAADGKISGVAAGTEDTDAVNVSQLNAVKETANKGWNLSTNGGEASKVAPDATVDFSGDKNISVSHDGTKVQVELNKNIDVNYVQTNALNAKYNLSVGTANENGTVPFLVNSTGAFYAANNNFSVDKEGKVIATAGEIGNVVLQNGVYTGNSVLRDGELYLGDASGNYSQITPKSAKLGQVTIDEKGNMAGVNSIQTNALNAKYNLSVGTMAENGIMPFLVNSTGAFYAANNNFSVDKDGKVIATAGEIGNVVLQNGVYTGNSVLRDGELYLGDASGNYSQITPKSAKLGQVTIDEKGNMAGVNSIQTNALNAKYNLSVGTMAENGIMPFLVNSTGAFYAANNNFSVDKDGKVIATAGEIGNVVLQNGVYTGNSVLRDGELYVGDASGNYSQITTTGAKLGQVTIAADGKISGVAAGTEDTDAVNVSQLNAVKETANKGWNLSTNGGEASKVAPDATVDFSGDKNISVSHDGTKVQVELNKNIDVNYVQTNALNAKYNLSVGTANENGTVPFLVNSTGAFYAANNNFSVDKEGKVIATAGEIGNVVLQNGVYTGNSVLRDGELYLGDASGNYSQITPKSAKLGQVTIDEKGNMAGVNSIQTNALNAKYNLSVGTMAENGIMPFLVNSTGAFYAANNNFSVDKYGKVIATAGEIGNVVLQNGVYTGNSALRDGELYVGDADGNYSQITTKGAKLGKVTVAEDGKISGVAAGAVTADSTDAVNGSQLHAVATEAGKHSKVVNGSNINVEEFDNDGQKIYKVNLNKDILLGDITGKNVSISGTNGTIETTGYIATKDRIIADKGAKLADVDITGDTISNDKSSVKLDKEGTVTINNKVTIDGNGKVSGVADGEISDTSTDAVNGSQLKKTNDRVTNVENDVKNIQGDITNIKGDITNIKGDITTIKGDVTNLDNRVTKVEQTAGKHSSVSTEDTNIQITEGTNTAGGIDYKLSLNKDQNLNSVTTGNTKMDTNGITVGDKVSLTKDGLMAGETKVTNDGLSIGGKTYVSKDGLNANNQTITNVADGKVEKGSTDAVNGGQLYETNQAIANNATNISSLSHSISNLDNRVNKVGAGAAALAALHPLDFDPDAKWDFAAGYGNYRGANAAAVGAYYRPNEDTMFSVGGTFGNGENMVNAGVSFKLGSGSSHVSTSRVAMAKEIKELRGELEAMKSAMLDANAGKKIDTSKLQLFPDVPQNHWAYEYVAQLAGNGMIEGYPDGNFAGDRPMTRYEFAAILYRAMTKGAVLSDKILSEFSHELEYFTVDTIAKDKAGNPTIQRVRTVKENKNK